MQVRRVVAVATLAVLATGAHMPAMAAKKAPAHKAYDMQLLPVPDPPQGTPSCARDELIGVSIHQETLKTTGPGTLTVKVNGFSGDWDITVFSGDHELEGVGDGTSTGAGAPATAGEDTFEMKFKKATTLDIRTCNFAGSPSAHGEYTFTYK
ncbi:MAG: hypothetical protein QOI82_981 [Actinomycetota bacterium]|jgi:hypothetical protein|nr:hypothetical protein [Actinomycetota bacterium]